MQTGALLTTWTPSGKQASVHRVMTFVQSSRTGKTTKTHIVQRCLQIKVKMTKHKTQGHDLWERGRTEQRFGKELATVWVPGHSPCYLYLIY